MWLWQNMIKVKWSDRVRTREELMRIGEERNLMKVIRKSLGWVVAVSYTHLDVYKRQLICFTFCF